ncbi:hypothetical protein [Streptomyces sp. NPDC048350]|uniref:hypothetical protein n=1 Tax=Streptomyces sp. NPDC048350 TaxID=3365538 RepID=UPI003714A14E
MGRDRVLARGNELEDFLVRREAVGHRITQVAGHAFLEDPDYGDTLAGFESTRTRLWGSEGLTALGCRFFPRLDGDDLYVERNEIDDFLAEPETLRPHLDRLADEGCYDTDHVTARFASIVTTALGAKAEGGGIVVR